MESTQKVQEKSGANDFNGEVDMNLVQQLMEFGFGFEEAMLALKISQNDMAQAGELLSSGGAELETLRILAKSAQIQKDTDQFKDDLDDNQFYPEEVDSPKGKATKMVIVVRQDQGLKNLSLGKSAQFVSEGVVLAYQRGQEFNKKVVSVWENQAWPKIALKCDDLEELLKIEENAKNAKINSYVLRKKIALPLKSKTQQTGKQVAEEEVKNAVEDGDVNSNAEESKSEEKSEEIKADLEQPIEEKEEPILCVVGPGYADEINKVTGHLKLL